MFFQAFGSELVISWSVSPFLSHFWERKGGGGMVRAHNLSYSSFNFPLDTTQILMINSPSSNLRLIFQRKDKGADGLSRC
jgi:hypothetical protein